MEADNQNKLFLQSAGLERKKKKKRSKRKKRQVSTRDGFRIPPHYSELLKKDPRELIDYEPDYIDLRIDQADAFTATGTLNYISPSEIPVTIWDPADTRLDASFANFGKRGTGKSYLTRDILYVLQKKLDHGIVFTGTKLNYWYQRVPRELRPEDVRKDPPGFIPEKAVIDGFNEDLLAAYLDYQADIRCDREKWREKGVDLPGFVILDDVVDKNEIRTSGTNGALFALFAKGRHYKLLSMINTQYPKAIPARMRENLDYAVVFEMDSYIERKSIVEDFMGELPTRTAYELLRLYTHGILDGPKQCLIINLKAGTRFEDKYKTYVAAPEVKPFMVGSKKYQEENAYDSDYFI